MKFNIEHNIVINFLISHNIIKGDFYVQGFIYIKNHKPTNDITTNIKWLEEISIHCYFKDLYKIAFDKFNNMYPQYKGFINLY